MIFKIPKKDQVLIHFPKTNQHQFAEIQPDREEFQLLIWNVYKGQLKNHFYKEFKKLARESDFILLQEAMNDDEMPEFFKNEFPDFHWWLALSWLKSSTSHGTGVCIGSVHQVIENRIQFAHQRELWFLTPKMTLFSEFEIQGVRVLFINTHVLNLTTDRGYRRQLTDIAEVAQNFQGPVCLAGDFNSWSMKRYLIMKKVFRQVGLEHVDPTDDQRLLPLDHLFIRGLEVVQVQIHHEMKGSDHLPLTAKLKLAKVK